MPQSDISKMKVVDLMHEPRLRVLPISGNITELQERLQKALDNNLSLKSTAISGEDHLEDASTVGEERVILTLPPDENELLKSPTSELNREILSDKASDEDVPQSKKIVLKRKISITSLSTEPTVSATVTETDLADVVANESESPDRKAKIIKLDDEPKQIISSAENGSDSPGRAAKILKPDEKLKQVIRMSVAENGCDTEAKILKINEKPKQVIKMSALTLEERLQLRAKKFGLEEIKVSGPNVNSVSTGAGAKDPKQIETLKKRAERFGCVVSSTIAKISTDDRLEKRKQRFQVLLKRGEKTASVLCKDIYAEKARQRLERFKTTSK